jgi:Flp pilus assembly protein TadG
MITLRRFLSPRKGQGMIEFALLAPAFFLLLLGVVDFGRAGFYYVSTVDLARQTARYAAAYKDGAGFTSAQVGAYEQQQANATAMNTPTLISTGACARPTAAPTLACQKPSVGQTYYWVVKCIIPTCNPETVTVTVITAFTPTTPMISTITGTIYLYADSVMIKEYVG